MKPTIFNYQKICNNLLKDLPSRPKEVISRRFGLASGVEKGKGFERETLESIGDDYNVTRERIRQIEEVGLLKLKPKLNICQGAFQYFSQCLKENGCLKKEESLLNCLGGEKFQNEVFFLLTVGEPFEKFNRTKEFYSLWTINPKAFNRAQRVINSFREQLIKRNRPLPLEELSSPPGEDIGFSLANQVLLSYLEISKTIQQGPEGLFGLREWPEVNPAGVKDWACLVFKIENRPLHFTEVSDLINKLYHPKRESFPQTVHNELIKDPRFVLVGRGIYGLKEWGYESGVVKDVVSRILERARRPLSCQEIIDEVLKQRFVKTGTILLNLHDKKYFIRDSEGNYTLRN